MTSDQQNKAIDFVRKELAKTPRPRVLVVEDNHRDRVLLMDTLSPFNCEVLLAHNAKEAIDKINENGILLVLLDLKMPGMPGIEVLLRTKGHNPNMHFIITSGLGVGPDIESALREGAVLVIEKPVTKRHLEQFLLENP